MAAPKVRVRRMKPEDIPALVECAREVYRDYTTHELYPARTYEMQLHTFREGQFVAVAGKQLVGYASALIIQLDEAEHTYTYNEITGAGTFKTHNPSGDTLYGADIGVHPDWRGQGVAGLLYEARKKLLRRYNLRRMLAYGRIPGYRQFSGKLTPEEYVVKVVAGEASDMALKAHLKAGYRVKRVLLDFMRDPASLNYATLLELDNSDYQPQRRKIAASPLQHMVRKVRVCAAQYMMRRIRTWEEFEQNVEFFMDSADYYHSHFLVLPELFTANLFSTFSPTLGDREAAHELAKLTDRYIEMMSRKAVQHSLFVVGGSHPTNREGRLYNTAYLFTPSGNVYTQDKLHITPSERAIWGFSPGEEIKVFDTSYGRIGIQVCYDVEFPEVSRLMALGGVDIIFVPFSTDEKKAYYRVRLTARARAIENYLYVVIAGNVGNLPTVKSYLLNYGQAGVFTPSDFAFPLRAIEGETDPNTETVVISELDLSSLAVQREVGSVRPMYERRPDLYELTARTPLKYVRVE